LVSFDVFFQGFIAGESSERGGADMREVLASHVIERSGSFLRVRVGDGEADIYLHDAGMMATTSQDWIRGIFRSGVPKPPTG
jgi:hypothetical protein